MKDVFAFGGVAMVLLGLGLWSVPVALVAAGTISVGISLVMHYGNSGLDSAQKNGKTPDEISRPVPPE